MTYRERRDRGGDLGGVGLQEKVVSIRRVAKVVKGGRNFSFNAMVVVGDGSGQVGIGLGKAGEVPEAVRKGAAIARKTLFEIPMKGSTIPHEIISKYGGAKVLLKPASPGTGVIAGGSIRAVVSTAGIRDILTKSLGSSNPINVVKATYQALQRLKIPEDAVRARQELAAELLASPPPEPRSPRPPRPTPPRRRPDAEANGPPAAPAMAPAAPAMAPAEPDAAPDEPPKAEAESAVAEAQPAAEPAVAEAEPTTDEPEQAPEEQAEEPAAESTDEPAEAPTEDPAEESSKPDPESDE